MKDLFRKKALYVLIYVALALFMESMTFLAMKNGVAPKYFLLDLSVVLMLATVIFVVPSFTASAILTVLLLFIQFVFSFLNYTLNNINGSVFTLEMMNLANEAAGAFTSDFMDWGFFFLLILIPVAAVLLLVWLKKYRVPYQSTHHVVFLLVTLLAMMSIGTSAGYNLTVKALYDPEDKSDPKYLLYSDAYLYNTFVLKDAAFKKFGTFAFYYVSLDRIIENKLSDTVFGGNGKKGTVLAEELSAIDKYLSGKEYGKTSAYTGAIAGQNVIAVMVESGEWYAVDETLTPTLYALMTQGVSNTDYFSRDKTNHSEAIGILGSYPVETPFTSNYSSNDTLLKNDLAFSFPEFVGSKGYTTSFFHSNWGSYYGRKTTHKTYGFQNFYALEDMTLPGSFNKNKDFYEFDLDSNLFSMNLERIAPNDGKPFYSFITTLTTHGHYDDLIKYGDYTADLSEEEKAALSQKYTVKGLEPYYEQITYDYFLQKFGEKLRVNGLLGEEQEYSGRSDDLQKIYLRYKRYQAAYMDLDRGVASLLNYLEETGLLDNTTLLFYGDHSAYYSDQNYYLKGITKGSYMDVSLYNVLFGLYSGVSPLSVEATGFTHAGDETSPLTGVKLTDRFSSSFDIVPTLLDLLGYTYNRGIYMGSSMFSEEGDIAFISRESGMLTDKYFSSDGIEILFGDDTDEAAVEDFRAKVVNYLQRQIYFEKIYLYDFFKYGDQYEYANIEKLVHAALPEQTGR